MQTITSAEQISDLKDNAIIGKITLEKEKLILKEREISFSQTVQ